MYTSVFLFSLRTNIALGQKKFYFVYLFIFVMIIPDRPSCLKGTKTILRVDRDLVETNCLCV